MLSPARWVCAPEPFCLDPRIDPSFSTSQPPEAGDDAGLDLGQVETALVGGEDKALLAPGRAEDEGRRGRPQGFAAPRQVPGGSERVEFHWLNAAIAATILSVL